MNISTNKKTFRPFQAVLLVFSLIGLIIAPWLLKADDQPAPKPIDLTQASLRSVPESINPINVNQSLLLVAPLNGPLSLLGEESRRGAELALRSLGAGFNLEQANEEERVETQVPNLKDVKAVLGHFSEKSLTRNAPYYIHYDIPTILPYLENPEVSSLNENFYRLMPDYATQGRRLAQEVLSQSKKPTQVVILVGPERPQRLLADAFANALSQGLTIPPSGQNKSPKKLAPLSSKIKVHRFDLTIVGELSALADLKGGSQDFVLLALPPNLALEAGPVLATSKFAKSRYLAGGSLALREVGAEYRALNLILTLCLPVIPAPKNNVYATFMRRYQYFTKNSPTWPAILAYDAANMAIKAASIGNVKEYLRDPDRPHQGLATSYVLNKGAPPQLLKIGDDNLSFLP
ncbi:MAG: ABC transporter substrate-binding protein [Deltaproteobacteria bacterium]|jgi:ABC-type branched-subunit amino acid transport system substrate-binding protein|nr:ABC transporter substrate-binding protein [Deltaproteobacteria bacterium]